MASRIHSILPRVAMVVMPLLLGGIGYAVYHRLARRYDVPNGSDIFRAVEGKWAQSGSRGNCDTNWVAVRFTPNHAELMLAYPMPRCGRMGSSIPSSAILCWVIRGTRYASFGAAKPPSIPTVRQSSGS